MKKCLLLFIIFTSSLTYAQDLELWGFTYEGGSSNAGVIFKYNVTTSTYDTIHNFTQNAGRFTQKQQFTAPVNGKMYALARSGGQYGSGAIIEFDIATKTTSTVASFEEKTTGAVPIGSLLLASDGNYYCFASEGGEYDQGTMLRFNSQSKELKVLTNFTYDQKRSSPWGIHVEASNQRIYGICSGGDYFKSVLIEYNISTGNIENKFSFNKDNAGEYVMGSLVEADNGNLYGITSSGGTNDKGTIFSYNPNSGLLEIHVNLDDSNTGYQTVGGFMKAENGMLYLFTRYGGAEQLGALLKFDPSTNSIVTIKPLDVDSKGVIGVALQGNDGYLYALSENAGQYYNGGILKIDTSTVNISLLHKFDKTIVDDASGSLMQSAEGNLYGMTLKDGKYNAGIIFEYNIATDQFAVVSDLGESNNGVYPTGALFQASDKFLYGTTQLGGASNNGVLFRLDPNTFEFTKLVDFNKYETGYGAWQAQLVQINYKLYGLNEDGSNAGYGVLYSYDLISNKFEVLRYFSSNASYLIGGLVVYNNLLYGIARYGGDNGDGALFSFDPTTENFQVLASFDESTTGNLPTGGLSVDKNGNFYLTTNGWGSGGFGALLEYRLESDQLNTLFSFSHDTLGAPNTGPVLSDDGKLYGAAGNLYEYDLATGDMSIIKHLIDQNNKEQGYSPLGKLHLSDNGNLYGMTESGGIHDEGVIFEYNIANSTYSKLYDLSYPMGKNGDRNHLIEIEPGETTSILNAKQNTVLSIYPNPACEYVVVDIIGNISSEGLVELIDIKGEVVWSKRMDSQNLPLEIDISNLNSGIYICRLVNKNNSYQQKLTLL